MLRQARTMALTLTTTTTITTTTTTDPMIREFGPEALVVVSADAVYKLDYRDVAIEHLDSGASVTMLTKRVDRRGKEGLPKGTVVPSGRR